MSTRLPEGYTLESHTRTDSEGVSYYCSEVKKGTIVLTCIETPLPPKVDKGYIDSIKRANDDYIVKRALDIFRMNTARDDTSKYENVAAYIRGKVEICNHESVMNVHEAFLNINNPATAALNPGIDMEDVVCVAENIRVNSESITVDIIDEYMGLSLLVLRTLIDEEPVGTVWNLTYTSGEDSGLISISKNEVRVVPISELQSHYIQHHGWF